MVGETDQTTAVSRRDLLRAVAGASAGAGAGAGAVGVSGRAAAQTTHTVDMNDQLQFVPSSITIAPGDTVVWENVGSVGHSVTAYGEEIPDDANYFASGGFDSEQAARDAYPEGDIPGGESYQHTFEVEGTYGYFCIPHETAGMVGDVTVTPGGAAEGGGGTVPGIPDSAKTLGIAALGSMLSVVALVYFFMKYGGDYGPE